ncbi:DUF4390 domain-containing protein [Desulfogranum japonicum]|uniref:DUF4390 domain-containing protein n=1 Tax=Desulfogranum japonicum TaxID=231447 RepID=UPI00054ECEFA|nr:DUF4390 domain-containing protein [Desulfogranum japonicum]
MKHFSSLLFSIIFMVLLLLPASGLTKDSSEPELTDIIVTTSNTHLLIFATVSNAFTPDMVEGVQNGLPITFVFKLQLTKLRPRWFNSDLVDIQLTHTLTYDSLKEEYTVQYSYKKGKLQKTRSLNEAKQLMAELNGLRVIDLSNLLLDAPYAIRLKATLAKNTLPLGMHYVLPFTSLWDFETDWRTIEFRY